MKNLTDLLKQADGLSSLKDEDSNYIFVSENVAELVGWKSSLDCAGKTDHDLLCPAVEFANEFIKTDKQIIQSGEKLLTIDIQNYSSGYRVILTERSLVLDAGGKNIFCRGLDITDSELFKSLFLFYQFDSKFLGKNSPISYILSKCYSPLVLTYKQELCLFWLIRGKSIKETAKALGLSPRTVETHLDAIKNRFNCQTKGQVIEYAIDKGFLYFIPEKL